jgi:hypothetical protein
MSVSIIMEIIKVLTAVGAAFLLLPAHVTGVPHGSHACTLLLLRAELAQLQIIVSQEQDTLSYLRPTRLCMTCGSLRRVSCSTSRLADVFPVSCRCCGL